MIYVYAIAAIWAASVFFTMLLLAAEEVADRRRRAQVDAEWDPDAELAELIGAVQR